MIGGTQTSLWDRELRTTGAADADMLMAKEKRSATGDLKSIKVRTFSNGWGEAEKIIRESHLDEVVTEKRRQTDVVMVDDLPGQSLLTPKKSTHSPSGSLKSSKKGTPTSVTKRTSLNTSSPASSKKHKKSETVEDAEVVGLDDDNVFNS